VVNAAVATSTRAADPYATPSPAHCSMPLPHTGPIARPG
jgi:hypothetical protein